MMLDLNWCEGRAKID